MDFKKALDNLIEAGRAINEMYYKEGLDTLYADTSLHDLVKTAEMVGPQILELTLVKER